MIEDRIETTCPPSQAQDAVGDGSGVEDAFPPDIVDLAEAGAIDGFLLPDELQQLCRAVLDHVERSRLRRI